MSELPNEMEALRLILARRIREKLESDDPVAPAFLDVARRFLLDNTSKTGIRPPPPLVTGLPFPADDDGA